MRTIKFRGKRIDNKEWVYGYLYELPLPSGDACMILTQDNNHVDNSLEPKYHLAFTLWVDLFAIYPATVGQFTGVCDCDLEPIYEGDLLMSLMLGETFEVVYEAPRFCVKNEDFGTLFINDTKQWKVVGNVHDFIEEKGGEE